MFAANIADILSIFRQVTLDEKLKEIPASPGVYLHKDAAGKTIYIGKAKNLRSCDIEIDGKAPRPCLEYHIKRCLGPCVKGLCTPAQYQEAVRDVRLLLEGRNNELAGTLEERMTEASEEMRYEMAAKYRDLRKTVIKLSEQQKM